MFGISFSEFVVIICIVVIFVQPKDLPRFFRSLGKFYAQLKEAYSQLIKAKDDVMQGLQSEIYPEEASKQNHHIESESLEPYINLPGDEKKSPSEEVCDTEQPNHGESPPQQKQIDGT